MSGKRYIREWICLFVVDVERLWEKMEKRSLLCTKPGNSNHSSVLLGMKKGYIHMYDEVTKTS